MKTLRRLLVRFVVLLLLPLSAIAGDFPERSTKLVNDYAQVLSDDNRRSLEEKLVQFDDSTSTQLAIVLIRSTGNYEIADYSVQLFNNWKIGNQDKNNGILILVAVEDRHVFITTGYGIEGALPDALCSKIVNKEITPHFKNGDYYGGLDAATTSIIGLVKGEFTADEYYKYRRDRSIGGMFPLLLFLFIIIVVFASKARLVSQYARMNHLGFWAAWALLNAAERRRRGSWNTFSGGGFGGGSGFSGGGGFGGFGGGMSGGGGAGGSW